MKRLLYSLVFIFSSHVVVSQSKWKDIPSNWDLVIFYVNGSPKVIRGWNLEQKPVWGMYGCTEGWLHDRINITCDTCGYLPKYTFDVHYEYGYGDTSTIRIILNRDTINKYFNLKHLKE